MASAWITRREVKSGLRHRVLFRVGGHEFSPRYGGSFKTRREALARKKMDRRRARSAARPGPAARSPSRQRSADARRGRRTLEGEPRRRSRRQHACCIAWRSTASLPILGTRRVDELTAARRRRRWSPSSHDSGYKRETMREEHHLPRRRHSTMPASNPNPARDQACKSSCRARSARSMSRRSPSTSRRSTACCRATYRLAAALARLVGCASSPPSTRCSSATTTSLADGFAYAPSMTKTRRALWVELPGRAGRGDRGRRCGPREDRDPKAPLFPGVER